MDELKALFRTCLLVAAVGSLIGGAYAFALLRAAQALSGLH